MTDTLKRMSKNLTDWEKIFVNHRSDSRLISRIYKKPLEIQEDTTKFFEQVGKDLTACLTNKTDR